MHCFRIAFNGVDNGFFLYSFLVKKNNHPGWQGYRSNQLWDVEKFFKGGGNFFSFKQVFMMNS